MIYLFLYYVNGVKRDFLFSFSSKGYNETKQKERGGNNVDVIETILQMIRQAPEKMISFRTYMDQALYSPVGGYYQQTKPKIGKQGDFYTNVSVDSVYGEVLADVIWEMVSKLSVSAERMIVEMGGGTGQLSKQILNHLRNTGRLSAAPIAYIMIEASAYHRMLQEEALASFRDMVDIRWYESIAHAKQEWPLLYGVLFSNELPDAFPVHLIEYRRGLWHEVYVTESNDQAQLFVERLGELSTPALAEYIKREKIPPLDGYRTEVNLDSLVWMEEIAGWLAEGYILTIDYGYERSVLYAPFRKKGTLLCYREHTMSENPYEMPGASDITTHVNFSALMDVAAAHGLETCGFYTQQQFLIQAGILKRLQEHTGGDPFRNEAAKRNRAIQQLIMPTGMGQAFRVLIQGKNVDSDIMCCKPLAIEIK
jgi:SAM-dependent MidA family methyltransferase